MVIVFGSVNLDLIARPARLPAAGDTVLAPDYVALGGGKGANQALAARRAGASVALVGAVGRDAFAGPALALLEAEGVDLGHVARLDAPTGLAFIAVDAAGENQIVVASGANARVKSEALAALSPPAGSILLVQGELDPVETAKALALGRARGWTTLLNLAPAIEIAENALAAADILVVNAGEARVLADRLAIRDGTPADRALALARRLGAAVIVTLGAEGALLADAEKALHVLAHAVDAVDTTGAGDAFCGALAACLDRDAALIESVEVACVAGALACLALGAQSALPTRAAIEAARAHFAPLNAGPDP